MKKISKSVWAAVSIYVFSCMPAQGRSTYSIPYIEELSNQLSSRLNGRQVDQKNGLIVNGLSEKTVRSDRAIFSLQISVIGNSLDKVVKKIKRQLQELRNFWKKEGILPSMIQVRDLEISVQDLEWSGHKKAHKYSITCPIKLIIDDVEKAPKIQEKTMELTEKDFILSKQNLKYQYTKKLELKQQLMIEALKYGKKLAQKMAKALGLSITSYPQSIEKSWVSSHSLASYPERYADRHSNELDNVFVVTIPIKYGIVSSETMAPKTPEKI